MTSTTETPQPLSFSNCWLVVCLLAAILCTTGCEQPTVTTNPVLHKFAKKLQKLVVAEDDLSMDDLAIEIDDAVMNDQMTEREAEQLMSIIVAAEAHEWEAATEAVKKLVEASEESNGQ